MQRRNFLSAMSLGGCSLLANASGSPRLTAPPTCPGGERAGKRRTKIGCVSWNFHSLASGAHPEEAIDIIGGLGFEGVELIANSRTDIDECENHTHTMLPVTDSFLRLCDAIPDPAFGCNLDCGWAMNQREYPPIAIHKLNQRLLNLHLRDIDARMREYVAIGQGVMDFKAIADAVKAIGFTGCLSLEQDGSSEDMKETCRHYISMMKEYLA